MKRLFPSDVRDVIIPSILKKYARNANELPLPRLPAVPEALLRQDTRGPDAISTFEAIIWLEDLFIIFLTVLKLTANRTTYTLPRWQFTFPDIKIRGSLRGDRTQNTSPVSWIWKDLDCRFYLVFFWPQTERVGLKRGVNIAVVPDYGYKLFLKRKEAKLLVGWAAWEEDIIDV